MMKSNLKKEGEKAITVLALSIAIIVLLILSGVTMAIIINNNGIIGTSKTAADKLEQSQENTLLDLDEVSNEIDQDLYGKRWIRTVDSNTHAVTITSNYNDMVFHVGDYIKYDCTKDASGNIFNRGT